MSKPEGYEVTISGPFDTGLAETLTIPTVKALALGYEIDRLVWVNGQPYKITGFTDRADGQRQCSLRLATKRPEWGQGVEEWL